MNVTDLNSESLAPWYKLQPPILPNADNFSNIHENQEKPLVAVVSYIHPRSLHLISCSSLSTKLCHFSLWYISLIKVLPVIIRICMRVPSKCALHTLYLVRHGLLLTGATPSQERKPNSPPLPKVHMLPPMHAARGD